MSSKDIIITGLHMDLTEALKDSVHEKAERLFNHEERIIRLRVELEYNENKGKGKQREFIAKGHIEINGSPMIVSVESDDLYKSIDQMIDKLDRKIRRRARLHKVKRNNPHGVEIPAELPKVEVA